MKQGKARMGRWDFPVDDQDRHLVPLDLIDGQLTGENDPLIRGTPERRALHQASMDQDGQFDAVKLVAKEDGRFQLDDGRHRCHYAKNLGWRHVAASISKHDAKTSATIRFHSNWDREDLEPMHAALELRDYMQDAELDRQTVAKRIGKSPSWVTKILALLEVPPSIAALHPEYIVLDDVSWWKPLLGHDELAERVAEKIKKFGTRNARRNAVEYLRTSLGSGKNALGTAPLDPAWLGRYTKINKWDLYTAVKDNHTAQARKLDHANFGTKTSPDLIIVWDIEAGRSLADEITAKKRAAKAAYKAKEAAAKAKQATVAAAPAAKEIEAQRERERQARIEEENQQAIAKREAERLTNTLQKGATDEFLGLIGQVAAGSIRARIDKGPARDVLREILGKHSSIISDETWQRDVMTIQANLFAEIFGKDQALAWRLLGFVLHYGPHPHREEVHRALIGETSKQTEVHARRAAKKARDAAKALPVERPGAAAGKECPTCTTIVAKKGRGASARLVCICTPPEGVPVEVAA